MTPSDFLFGLAIYGPLGLPLLYILTILLRVSCHFTGVEIPALGRAFFTTTAIVLISVVIAYLLQYSLIGFEGYRPNPIAQFVTLALALAANLFIATGLYRLLLGVPFGKALTLWLFQAGLFGLLLLIVGCCGGVLAVFWARL